MSLDAEATASVALSPAPVPRVTARPLLITTAFQLTAAFDRLRLTIMRDASARSHAIRIGGCGAATLLRFDDAAYFNRAYVYDEAITEEMEDVEAFYDGSPHGCQLIAPMLPSYSPIEQTCLQRGWLPADRYAWLESTNVLCRPTLSRAHFEVRAPLVEERTQFLQAFLLACGADRVKTTGAVEHMRHLFSNPDLGFFMALRHGRPAGVAMMYRAGTTALLGGGATLPGYRGEGCHTALIAARVRRAMELGCDQVCGWALAGSQAHLNLGHAGLRTVNTVVTYRLPPHGRDGRGARQ